MQLTSHLKRVRLAYMSERVTLKMVAAKAGVGRSTVSLILNGRGDELGIARQTQNVVTKVAADLGYRPNSLAMGLAGKRTQTIGLLLPSGPFFPQYLMPQEMSIRLHRLGYQTYLVDSLQDPDVILEFLSEMSSRKVDGIVFYAYHNHMLCEPVREAIARFPVAVVVVSEPLSGALAAHTICMNIIPAIREVASHFATTGRRRPLMVAQASLGNVAKINAWRTAAAELGFEDVGVLETSKRNPADFDVFHHFLSEYERQNLGNRQFDAIFCNCDESAAAAVHYLNMLGRNVPKDVAVIGLNNTPWVQAMTPPLASICWKHPESCELASKRLVELLKNPGQEAGFDEITPSLVWRESAG